MKYVDNPASLRFSREILIEWDNLMKMTVWQDIVRLYSPVFSMKFNRKIKHKVILNFTTSSYFNSFA